MRARSYRLTILRLRRLLSRPVFVARVVGVLALAGGLAVTLAAAHLIAVNEREEVAAEFERHIEQLSTVVSSRFALYVSFVQAGRGLFAGADEVTHGDWQLFTAALGLPDADAGIHAFPFMQYIPAAELDMTLVAIRAGAEPGFTLNHEDERPYYCPIVFNVPGPIGASTIGFDACMSQSAHAAMMNARDRGEVVTTGRLNLINLITGETRPGVVVYGPIFRRGMPAVADNLHGWVALPVGIADVLAGAVPDEPLLPLRLYDGAVGADTLMYGRGDAGWDAARARTVDIELPGTTWVLAMLRPEPQSGAVAATLAAGGVISLLLFVLLWRAGMVHARAVSLAEHMTGALRESETKHRTIITSLEDAYFESDLAGNLTFFNDAMVRVLGYPKSELTGMNFRQYVDEDHVNHVFRTFRRIYQTGEPERGMQWQVTRKDGTQRYVEASIALIRDGEGNATGYSGIGRDITDRRRADERIHYLAHYDALTGLPNRALFEDRLHQVIGRRWRSGERAALLFVDLDRFKTVNDSLGHHTGDLLLQAVARRIRECVRGIDTVCRPGGDEFLVLLSDLAGAADAAHVAGKVVASVSEPYMIEGWEFSITPSIGIAVIPDDGTDIDTLIRNADAAMYHAKESGRNNFQFFTPELNEDAAGRLALEHGLRRALERDELELYYQPLVDLRDGAIIGAEALLRWHRPDHGLVTAGEFIGIVEQSGLILGIGEWVLREACGHARAWNGRVDKPVPVSVNLSALQFRQHGLPTMIAQVLEETGLDPACLELELTESVVMQDAQQTIETVRRLRELGVHFAIDDFGTGYSSLSYLKRFPIDRIKIDRSFIDELGDDAESTTIVDAIISMAGNLKLQVIAEGVETVGQLAYLRDQRCGVAQGYLFSRPVPLAEFERLLAQGFILPA